MSVNRGHIHKTFYVKFVTLGLNILRFLKLKEFLMQLSVEVNLICNKCNKISIFMCNSFINPVYGFAVKSFVNLNPGLWRDTQGC